MTSIKKSEILKSIKFCDENGYFEKLNDIYSALPKGECSGCGNCCMESVGINLIEFLNIYKHLMGNNELRKVSYSRIIDYYFLELIKKNSCPFKDENNRCLIYEVRPLNCRLYGHWREDDYNNNLKRVLSKNIDYKKHLKEIYDIDIEQEVLDFSIKYCKRFKPEKNYLSKEERLGFYDLIMTLDSKILGRELMNISYRDRGIVEYFMDYLMNQSFAYDVKLRISKEKNFKVVDRLKQILVNT